MPTKQETKIISVVIDSNMLTAIDRLAERENRSRSRMSAVLLKEALKMRRVESVRGMQALGKQV